MAFVPFPNVLQLETRWTWAGQQIENVTYWSCPDSPSSDDAVLIQQAWFSAWAANLQPLQATTLVFRENYFTSLASETAPTFTGVTAETEAGIAGTASLPNNCALVVSFRTPGRGRSARGRNYVPGLVEGQVTDNTVAQVFADAAVAFYDQWRADLVEYGISHVVASRIENGVERAVGLAQTVTDVIVVDLTVDSQRRRLPGRGR